MAGQKAKPLGVTKDQFAKWMGVGRHAVYEWDRKGAVVMFPDGSVDPIASCRKVDRIRLDREERKASIESAPLAGLPALLNVDESLRGLARPELEHVAAMYKAEGARVELAAAKRELIPVAEAARVVELTLRPIAEKVKGLPYRAGPRLVGFEDERKVIILLEAEVNNVLRSIAAIDPVSVFGLEPVQGDADPGGR